MVWLGTVQLVKKSVKILINHAFNLSYLFIYFVSSSRINDSQKKRVFCTVTLKSWQALPMGRRF